MEVLTDDAIPILPGILDVENESVALGVVEQGVIIQYPERDVALLINWEDIVNLGMGFLDEITSQESVEIEANLNRRIIQSPKKSVITR